MPLSLSWKSHESPPNTFLHLLCLLVGLESDMCPVLQEHNISSNLTSQGPNLLGEAKHCCEFSVVLGGGRSYPFLESLIAFSPQSPTSLSLCIYKK
jgi:hypothetical protein